MSRIERLPPDLSAALSLLLREDKRHADLADLLGIQERAVHDRAHAALALLAPAQARALSAERRDAIGEYLLGQQDERASERTRAELAADPAARAWAQALARELEPLARRPLPPIPAPSQPPQLPISRTGGAIVLGAVAAAIVVAVLVIVGVGGGGGSHGADQNASSTGPGASHSSSHPGRGAGSQTSSGPNGTSANETGTGAGSTSTGSSGGTSQPSHGKALELTPASPAASGSVGVAYVLSKASEHAFYVFAKGLPQLASGAFYAVWLEDGAGVPDYPLGSLPAATSSGLVEGGGPLPSNAARYHKIVVTTETSHRPTAAGPALLSGAFSMH